MIVLSSFWSDITGLKRCRRSKNILHFFLISTDLLISKRFYQNVREGKGVQRMVLIFDYPRYSASTFSNEVVSDDWTPFLFQERSSVPINPYKNIGLHRSWVRCCSLPTLDLLSCNGLYETIGMMHVTGLLCQLCGSCSY